MSRILLALAASFLTAATLSADVADLQASVSPPDGPAPLGREFRLTFKVHNGGPNVAHHVRALFTVPPGLTDVHPASPWFGCSGPDCRYDYVGPGQTMEIFFYAAAPAAAGRITIGMTLTADESDPNPADNTASMDVDVVAQPELGFWYTTAMQDAPPDSIRTLTFEPVNAGAPAPNAVVTIDLPAGGRFLEQLGDSPFMCELAGSRATCRAPSFSASLPNQPLARITLRFANPPLYEGGRVEATATITSDAVDLDPRNDHASIAWFIPKLFAVTNGEDSGPGSLRQAILDANADCPLRCVVDFRFDGPLPAGGFFTVRPRTPLPPPRFYGSIDGATQADLLGIESDHPLVMLDGAAQSDGDGITITVPRTDITDIAVGRFPRFGIVVFGSRASLVKNSTTIDRVYAGIDPAGAAAPNFRGIAAATPLGLIVTNSNVSGNHASGLAVDGGNVSVRNSVFESNGASGIYLAGYSEAVVIGNVLAHNHDFGVGLDAYQRGVQLSGNSIHDNGRGGIDVGLDGPTPNVADDSRRQPNYPTIESVDYDAAKQKTTIKLLVATQMPPFLLLDRESSFLRVFVEVYANGTPDGQAERLVGSADTYDPRQLTLTVNGDLRGQWLTAITLRSRIDCHYDLCASRTETSEISPAVYVP